MRGSAEWDRADSRPAIERTAHLGKGLTVKTIGCIIAVYLIASAVTLPCLETDMADISRFSSSAEGVAWNLADLYGGPEDPAIEEDLDAALSRAQAFEARYRGAIAIEGGIEPGSLCEALAEFEALHEQIDRALSYAHLVHAADSDTAANGALLQSVRERATAIRKRLIFFELEWLDLSDEDAQRLIADPELARYRHHLESERHYRPHRLTEPEEKILDEKANTGSHAFSRLFDEVLASVRFRIEVDGEVQEMSEQQALALLYHPDRNQRRLASDGFTQGLLDNSRLLTYIFNTLVADHKLDDELRGYPSPMASRNLSNEIDQESVDALLTCAETGYDIVHSYYRFKAGLLGVDKLCDYDRYAPVSSGLPSCDWNRCQRLVREAFRGFHGKVGDISGEFFDRSWIDAELRPGKRGGAFCSSTIPSVHPFILVNYTDRLRDVMTVAHELGHGIHQYLARNVGYLQCDAPLILAETASVFGEMLVFHRLMEIETDPQVRLGLLCGKLEDAFATAFRQVVLTRFEQKLHQARREEGELTGDTIGQLWLAANQPMHGDAVDLTPNYTHWWMYIPHFVHSPFYCYAYAFGELLVLALYQQYRQQGAGFVPRFMDFLSAGGSESPSVLLGRLGVDLADPEFYEGGLRILRDMLEEAVSLHGSDNT